MAEKRTQLETVIQTAIDSALKELHTLFPAVVTRVDNANQLIDAQITIKRKLAGELVNLPLLVNVPIRYPKSATFSITYPIEIGDHVEVRFCERSIDTWLINGSIQDPFDLRKHSLSDAFATPAMYPQTDLIPDFDPVNLEIKTNSGNTKIIVKSEGVEIVTTGQTDITSSKTVINNDVDILGRLTVSDGSITMVMDSAGMNMGTGVIKGANVFNGADSDKHVHPQGNDSGGDSQQNTGIPI